MATPLESPPPAHTAAVASTTPARAQVEPTPVARAAPTAPAPLERTLVTPVPTETLNEPIQVARTEPVTEVQETAEPADSHIERGVAYFGIGFGFGRGDIIERSFANDGAGTIGLRVGVIIADQVLLGVQGTLAGQYNDYRVEGDIAGAVGSGMVELTVFPVPFLAWSLGGGAGYAYARTLARDPAVASDVGTGLTWMAATGYDLFAGTGFNLGLQVRYQRLEAISSTRVTSACVWLNWY